MYVCILLRCFAGTTLTSHAYAGEHSRCFASPVHRDGMIVRFSGTDSPLPSIPYDPRLADLKRCFTLAGPKVTEDTDFAVQCC